MKKELDKAHDEFEARLLAFCGPIYIAPEPDAPPSEILANATFGLVDTGIKRLIVTCCHVWDFYKEQQAHNPETVMGVVLGTGFKTYTFKPRIIDADREIDLAIFEWDGLSSHNKAFFPVRRFPIPRIEVGGVIALQGFPGVQRQGTRTYGRFGAFFFGGTATAVSDRKILVMDDEARSLVSVETGEAMQPFEIRGLSGSPAYTFRNGWKLAGFVCEGKTTEDSLYLAHASFIMADGSLDRTQLS